MATIGMTNANQPPVERGPLTAADLDHSVGNLAPRIPRDRHVGMGALLPVALVVSIIAACGLLHWLLS